jgi:cytidylate kinase
MGGSVNLARLLTDIKQRDARDQSRIVSPLVPAEDAIVIDSTALSADEVLQAARDLAAARDL